VWGHHKIKGLAKVPLRLLFFGFQMVSKIEHHICNVRAPVRDLLSPWQNETVPTDLVKQDESAPNGHYFVTHYEMVHVFHYARKGSAASSSFPPNWI